MLKPGFAKKVSRLRRLRPLIYIIKNIITQRITTTNYTFRQNKMHHAIVPRCIKTISSTKYQLAKIALGKTNRIRLQWNSELVEQWKCNGF